MNLDHCAVVVRERSIGELYDLALALLRRQGLQVALLTAVLGLPCMALDIWLLHGHEGLPAFYAAWLLLAVQAPLVTAPVTAYQGVALFDRTARKRDAFRVVAGRAGPLALVALLRGVLALGGPLILLHPPYLVEVLLLERQPVQAAWTRANALAASGRGIGIAQTLVALSVMVGGTVAVWWGLEAIVGILAHGEVGEAMAAWWRQPLADPLPLMVVAWPLIAFLGVVRFLAYLDLRTRAEGWDVELDLLRAARRMMPESA